MKISLTFKETRTAISKVFNLCTYVQYHISMSTYILYFESVDIMAIIVKHV